MPIDLSDPANCTSFKTKQFSRLIARQCDVELAASGLKTSQYSLLTHVLRRGPINLGDLALRMGLSLATLSRNLKPLEEQGWVLRTAGGDARVRMVTITPAGTRKQQQTHKLWELAQERINALIGMDDVLALHAVINRCTANVQRTLLAEAQKAQAERSAPA